jgi:hypothetical protein
VLSKDDWKNIFKINKVWPIEVNKLLRSHQDATLAVRVSEINELKPKPNEMFFAWAAFQPPTY